MDADRFITEWAGRWVEDMVQKSDRARSQDGGTGQTTLPSTRPIFRTEVRQHYLQNQEKIILPNLVSTRVFVSLWFVSLLLAVAGTIIAFWPLI